VTVKNGYAFFAPSDGNPASQAGGYPAQGHDAVAYPEANYAFRWLTADRPLRPLTVSPGDYASGTGMDATITLAAAGVGKNHVLGGIAFGYRSTPTSGAIQIQDGADTVFRVPVTEAGAGFLPFPHKKVGSDNTAMTITLLNGGPGVVGEVSVIDRRVE
jgi:hypothetical protein